MSDRQLRARVLLEEAHALGLDLADLIAADTIGGRRTPTLEAHIEAVAPTFTPATAATYRPYWRLAAARLGDRRLVEITIEDLAAVVADAAVRARQARPASSGRESQEHCVAAPGSVPDGWGGQAHRRQPCGGTAQAASSPGSPPGP